MIIYYDIVRLTVISLGVVAMYRLWDARKRRSAKWTDKMRDIWRVQFGWSFAAVEGNVEFFYRHTQPSIAILLVVFLLVGTIKGTFGEKYTIDEP